MFFIVMFFIVMFFIVLPPAQSLLIDQQATLILNALYTLKA